MEPHEPSVSTQPAAITRPTGTVTFLFTDIEGSTERWERFPDAMRDALARHDRIVRRSVGEYGGYVFKTIGDAFCAAFSAAPEALAAALRAQRLLAAERYDAVDGLLVRMALHTGEAHERDDDYFGVALNRVARLLSTAHGGQVVLSSSTRDAVPERARTAFDFLDLGEHRLRNIATPQRIYQLAAPDLRAAFPPLLSLERTRHNLPPSFDTFVAQGDALHEIAALVERLPLLTLLGPGGIGKTRYALETGRLLLQRFADGAWFVELGPLQDPSRLAAAIGNALGIREQLATPMPDLLPSALATKEMLLILDNCEHVLDATADIVSRLLKACPRVHVLATSREALRTASERIYAIAPLQSPETLLHGVPSIEELRKSPAVRLFLDRAQSSNPGLRLRPQDAENLIVVCRRLDGIPLAIELAAARMSAMTVAQLGARLDDRFRLLTKGDRGALPRQQTLRALIDWSYALLSERERRCFVALSVFPARFSLAAASRVCSEPGEDDWAVFELIASLTDKSLLIRDADDETLRQLETTRYYGAEKLREARTESEFLHRHAAYYLSFARAAANRYGRTGGRAWLDEVRGVLENVRAALVWSLEQRHETATGIALTAAFCDAWMTLGLDGECKERAELALGACSDATPRELRARLLIACAQVAVRAQRSAIEPAERGVRSYRATDDVRGLATALNVLGYALAREERCAEADAHFEEALALATRIDDVRQRGLALLNLGVNRETANDFERTRELYEAALALGTSRGDDYIVGAAHLDLSVLCEAIEAPEKGFGHARQAFEAFARAGDTNGGALALGNLTTNLIGLGRMDDARRAARDYVLHARAYRLDTIFIVALEKIAAIAESSGDGFAAARLLGYTAARANALALKRDPGNVRFTDAVLRRLRETLAAALERSLADGAALSEAEAAELALGVVTPVDADR